MLYIYIYMYICIHIYYCLWNFIVWRLLPMERVLWSVWRSLGYSSRSAWSACGALCVSQQCPKLGKIFTGLTYKLLSGLIIILDVYRSFIRNKYCITRWMSNLPWSFEIHRVVQYLANFTGLVGIVNATVYKTEPIRTGLGHDKLS